MRARLTLPALWLGVLLCGCRTSDAPLQLLNVLDFAPKDADVGDRLELVGTAFPEGKPATLTFRGSLHRPGREPIHDVEIVAPATSTSQNRISLLLGDDLYKEFTGTGSDAAHTTFHGEVIGAFAPRTHGAPPVSGSLGNVVIDFAPPPGALDAHAENDAEGLRLLQFIGATSDPEQKQRLVIKSVEPKSRAARASLEAGDELLEFDGLRVRGPSDLIPSGKRHQVRLLVQHGRLREPIESMLDVDGFRAFAPAELSGAARLVGLAAALVLLFAGPLSRVIAWAERRAAYRLRAVQRDARSRPASPSQAVSRVAASLWTSLPSAMADKPIVRFVLYLTFLGSTALLTLLALGRALVLPELELIVLFTASLTAVSVMALILGGHRDGGPWSLTRGLANAALVTSCQLPAFAGVACVLLITGSLRLRDVVWAQGGAPWHWYAFKNPNLLVMFLLFLVSAVPEVNRTTLEIPELDSDHRRGLSLAHPAARVLTCFAEWASLLVASGLCAILFLGGWQVPFVSPARQEASLWLQALGALIVVAKSWTLVFLVLAARWTLPEVRVHQVAVFWWRWLIPMSVVGILVSVFWTYGMRNPLLREVQQGTGTVLFSLALFVLGYFVQRVFAGLRQASGQTSVNPWL